MLRLLIIMGALLSIGCTTPGDDLVDTKPTPEATTPAVVASASPGEKPVRLEKTVIKTKQGQRWEMEADTVDWMDNAARAKAQVVTWFLLNPQGQRTVKVESVGADVDMNAEIVTFTGEVVARRLDSKESLLVNHLVYNGKKRVFLGSEGVRWKREDIELSGETLTATAELDKVRLKGRVRGKSQFDVTPTPSPAQVDR